MIRHRPFKTALFFLGRAFYFKLCSVSGHMTA
nr:MAG TPA: hypothetical protein [Caudoviricetes sp.]